MLEYKCYISGCTNSPIGAHSISQGSMLKNIVDNGHLDSIIIGLGKKQGIKKNDSVFKGVCKEHDEIFYPLDRCNWKKPSITPEIGFLLAMRSHAKEWFQNIHIEQKIPAEADIFPIEEFQAKEKDHKKLREFFCKNYNSGNFEVISCQFRHMSYYTPLAYTSPMLLETGPDGVVNDLIHSVKKSIIPAPLFMTLFPNSKSSMVAFFCYKKEQSSKYKFIATKWVRRYNESQFTDVLNGLLFAYGENLYTKPDYLSDSQVKQLFMYRVGAITSAELTTTPEDIKPPFSLF